MIFFKIFFEFIQLRPITPIGIFSFIDNVHSLNRIVKKISFYIYIYIGIFIFEGIGEYGKFFFKPKILYFCLFFSLFKLQLPL
jgi:hypothetical protein